MNNFLTPDEIEEWTGYKLRGKQIEQLRRYRVRFWIPKDGWPRVPRATINGHVETPTQETPNYAAIGSLAAQVDHSKR